MTDLATALEGLRTVCPASSVAPGGQPASPEGLNQGYTHGFVMTFADAAANHYLTHPDHEKLGRVLARP